MAAEGGRAKMIKKYAVPIALLLLLSFIMFSGWGVYHLLEKDAVKLSAMAEKIQSSVRDGKWNDARRN